MTDNQRKEILREKIKNHRQEYMNSLPYVYEEAICEAMTQSEKLFAIEQLESLGDINGVNLLELHSNWYNKINELKSQLK